MTASAPRPSPVTSHRANEVVLNFKPEVLKAPFFLRCGALIIDYILVMLMPVLALVLSRLLGNDGARLLNSELNTVGWMIAVLLGFSNSILLPMYSGQSLGKILTGLRIVALDGRQAPVRSVALRQTFGYLLTLASAGLGFLTSVFSRKGRALHDYIAGTVVIHAERRVRQK